MTTEQIINLLIEEYDLSASDFHTTFHNDDLLIQIYCPEDARVIGEHIVDFLNELVDKQVEVTSVSEEDGQVGIRVHEFL